MFTVYAYDGYDRSRRVDYPGGTYALVFYDPSSNVVYEVRRSGEAVTNGYEDLDRLVSRTPSGGPAAVGVYAYDLYGRLTSWGGC